MNKTEEEVNEHFSNLKRKYEEMGVNFDTWKQEKYNPNYRICYVIATIKIDEIFYFRMQGDTDVNYLYGVSLMNTPYENFDATVCMASKIQKAMKENKGGQNE